MQLGISTASLFGRLNTEQALQYLSENKVQTAEVFLSSFCEYKEGFGKELCARKGYIEVHSVHTLTTQFEPTLYSVNPRAKADSFEILHDAMRVAKMLGAKYYTFHGGARFKKTPIKIDYERVGKITQEIMDVSKSYGVTLAYENVHWGYYNYIGFFRELKKRVPELKATFDIKQARQNDIPYSEFIDEMGSDIVTFHISDYLENGKMCLPGKGVTDFKDVFSRLNDKGFDGGIILECYQGDYVEKEELFESLFFIQNLTNQIFGK